MSAKEDSVAYGRIRIFVALLLAGAASLYVSLSSCGTEVGPHPPIAADPPTSVLTYHNDATRTGQNLNETVLTLSNVNAAAFGRIGFLSTIGMVDAEPLVVGNLNGSGRNVVYVASEGDIVYAFDADNFSPVWQVSLLPPGEVPSDDHGCPDTSPNIGILSTPVIDPQAGPHGTIFAVAMSKDAGGNYHQRLHALDLATGGEQSGSPVAIQATYPTASGTTTFLPGQTRSRAGLLLHNGVIYIAWGSICDFDPYQGWILGYSESNLQQVSVFNTVPNGSKAGVWMAGDGLAVDSSGFLYFTVGNGTFDTTLNAAGFPVNSNFGNAFIKASVSDGSFRVVDYFTMQNTVDESENDKDLGSGGVIILPDLQDSSGTTVHLALAAGKDGNVYVVNRDSMGKFNAGGDGAVYQEIDAVNGAGGYGTPAYFNGTIYTCGQFATLKAFPISNARLATSPSSETAVNFAYPGTFPSISANGSSNGIVWAVERNGNLIDPGNGVLIDGALHAYDASNLANELYNSDQAPGGRDHFTAHAFTTPTIANGKVYVGTRTGVIVFGLLH